MAYLIHGIDLSMGISTKTENKVLFVKRESDGLGVYLVFPLLSPLSLQSHFCRSTDVSVRLPC